MNHQKRFRSRSKEGGKEEGTWAATWFPRLVLIEGGKEKMKLTRMEREIGWLGGEKKKKHGGTFAHLHSREFGLRNVGGEPGSLSNTLLQPHVRNQRIQKRRRRLKETRETEQNAGCGKDRWRGLQKKEKKAEAKKRNTGEEFQTQKGYGEVKSQTLVLTAPTLAPGGLLRKRPGPQGRKKNGGRAGAVSAIFGMEKNETSKGRGKVGKK